MPARPRRPATALVPVALPIALLAVLAAGCGGRDNPGPVPSSGPRPSTAGVIAWLDAPTPAPSTAAPTPAATARPCLAADLPDRATYGRTGGISQSDSDVIRLTNVGGSPCTLDNRFSLLYTDGAGRAVQLPTDHAGIAQLGPNPATIGPGQAATLLVVFSRVCPDRPPVTFQGLILSQAGRRIPVPGLGLTGTCPTVSVGTWQPPETPAPVPPALRYGGLSALLTAPDTVRAGTTLNYQVTVTNSGTTDLAFDPCPAYQETIFKVTLTYRLNCAVSGVPAGGTVRFAMRVAVPSGAPPGRTLLTWAIVEAGGRSAPASMTVAIT